MGRPAAIACLLVASAVLLGCKTPPTGAADDQHAGAGAVPPYTFAPDDYPAVHAATIDVLRDHGFRIARNDYRFGTVTTFPKESPTAAEFWIDDATTYDQHRADTLNAQQRTVRVRIARAGAGQRYALSVEVLVERLQQPARYLTHSARPAVTAEYAASPAHLADRGITGPYAQPVGRDPQLEARLQRAIADQAAPSAQPPPDPAGG